MEYRGIPLALPMGGHYNSVSIWLGDKNNEKSHQDPLTLSATIATIRQIVPKKHPDSIVYQTSMTNLQSNLNLIVVPITKGK